MGELGDFLESGHLQAISGALPIIAYINTAISGYFVNKLPIFGSVLVVAPTNWERSQ